MQTVTFTQGHF